MRRASAVDDAVVAMGTSESVNLRVGELVLHQLRTQAPEGLQLVERRLLRFGQRTNLAGSEVAELHGAELHTHKTVHFEANGLAHPAHFTIAPLGDGDR